MQSLWYLQTTLLLQADAPATEKDVDDKDAVDENENNVLDSDGNQVIIKGLKTVFKEEVLTSKGLLSPSDWYIIRKAEDAGSTIPSNIATYRAAIVRTRSNEMETQIDGAVDAAAIKLYIHTLIQAQKKALNTLDL